MEFKRFRCPVCNNRFADGDDIVVCPECGAPHHRECYEQEGHCFFDDRHGDDFSFEELNSNVRQETTSEPDPQQTSEQAADANETEQPGVNQTGFAGSPGGIPFGSMPFSMLDPLAGMNPEDEIADGIKVSEMAKYVGKNTPYFMIIFKRLFDTHRSRVNFSAFLFSGVYFIYRKMTLLGLIASLLNIALMVGAAALMMTPYYAECAAAFESIRTGANAIPTDTAQSTELLLKLLYLYLPNFLLNLQFIMMLMSGIFANRLYYKHCKKKIGEIKENTEEAKLGEKLEKAGGVNFPLALSLGAATAVIYLLILFI